MAKSRTRKVVAVSAVATAAGVWSGAFVPPPRAPQGMPQRAMPAAISAAAAAGALASGAGIAGAKTPPPMDYLRPATPIPWLPNLYDYLPQYLPAGTWPAYSGVDLFDKAAHKLAVASYPFMREINWNSYAYLLKPSSKASAADWLKAIDKAIVMGADMDPAKIRDAVLVHHRTIQHLANNNADNPVVSISDYEKILSSIGKMIASCPEKDTMAVYNAFAKLVDKDVPAYLMSTVDADDAKTAYEAFLEFKKTVKKQNLPVPGDDYPVPEVSPIMKSKLTNVDFDGAAAALSKAAYPFVKGVQWDSDLSLTPLPGVQPKQMLQAIDKMLVMGASMDGKLLQDAAKAHHKAIGSVDEKLVTSQADFTGVLSALGKLFASVPSDKVMDVFTEFSRIVDPNVPQYLFSAYDAGSFEPAQAVNAYTALMKFAEVTKTAQMAQR